jgi:hypothetical protein
MWLAVRVIKVVDFHGGVKLLKVTSVQVTRGKCTSKCTKLLGAGITSRPLTKIALSLVIVITMAEVLVRQRNDEIVTLITLLDCVCNRN